MKKNINYDLIIFLAGLLCGVFSIILLGDRFLDNEWRTMVYNLENYRILSSRNIDGEWVPNLLMPPLYPIFLFSIKKLFFFAEDIYVNIILFVQLIIFLISIYFFKKILKEIFNNKKVTTLGIFVFTFFPLNLYAVGQISSIGLQVFLFLLFIYNFVKYYKHFIKLNLYYLSIVSGLMILLRGEFFVFYLLTLLFLWMRNKKYLPLSLSILITIIILSPYLARNYYTFEVIALTKSTGFNLLKGNNPKSKVEGIAMWDGYDVVPETKIKLREISPIKKYDLASDKIFLEYAIKFISEDPARYIILYLKKFLSFLFIDVNSSYPGYYSLLNIIPKLIISSFSLFSIVYFSSIKMNLFNYFSILYIFNAFIFSFFFILPRYTLSVLPIQIIISLFLYEKFLNKKKL